VKKQQGFTLIELLITMAIFSVIAVISYYALGNSFKNEPIQTKHSESLFALQKTLNYFERDIAQISNQNITLNNSYLSFTSLQNEQLLKLKYVFNSGHLQRLDITKEELQPAIILLNDLNKISIRALTDKNIWTINWVKKDKAYLKAIEIKFTHPYWGNITKLVMIDE
jgi:prepilin-type N-terminal cleavage/methylation domain-containing protein